ncbi:hypothetical protein LCGC14_2848610 [marine sediment metagenome]|uniref:Uncharacterized protein n=1 Tax=marine sediment metagenome TaxID=412755 RepID=A0A0F9AHF0_9ZZZZ
MAKTTAKSKVAQGSGGGRDVPVVSWEVGITLNMGDFNSIRTTAFIGNIDASSDEATRREAKQAARSSTILYEAVDNQTGEVLNSALGEAGSGEIQAAFLKALADTMERNSKKGLYKKGK